MYLYFDEYKKNNGDAAAQARWSRLFTWEIARLVYPLMEKHLGEKGKKLADNDRLDHQVHHFHQSSYVESWLSSNSMLKNSYTN